jgi:hypothetical protein
MLATNEQSSDETFESNLLTTGTGITKMSWPSTQLTIDSLHSEKHIRRPQRIATRGATNTARNEGAHTLMQLYPLQFC